MRWYSWFYYYSSSGHRSTPLWCCCGRGWACWGYAGLFSGEDGAKGSGSWEEEVPSWQNLWRCTCQESHWDLGWDGSLWAATQRKQAICGEPVVKEFHYGDVIPNLAGCFVLAPSHTPLHVNGFRVKSERGGKGLVHFIASESSFKSSVILWTMIWWNGPAVLIWEWELLLNMYINNLKHFGMQLLWPHA